LEALVNSDDKDDDLWSADPKSRAALCDPGHLQLYMLWRNMGGMGGESLSGLWKLYREPGSAALLKDFSTLSAREKKFKRRKDFLGGKKSK